MSEPIVFFSGFEKEDTLRDVMRLMENGFPLSGVLVSFLNIENKTIRYLKNYKDKYDVSVMLDSGAFSLIKAWYYIKGQNVFAPNKRALSLIKGKRLNWYFRKYLKFVKKYSDLFDVYVELDLQMIVGDDKVNLWRERFKEEGLEPVLVWHGENIDKINQMLYYSDHFGLPWRHPGVSYEYMMSIVRYVRKNTDGWIHWFGMTKWNDLKSLILEDVLNSADSTSWLGAQRYGTVYVVDDGGKIVTLQVSPNKKNLPERRRQMYIYRYRKFLSEHEEEIKSIGLDYDGIYSLTNWEHVSYLNLYLFNKALLNLIEDFKNGRRVRNLEMDSVLVDGKYDFSDFRKYKRLDEWFGDGKEFRFRKDADLRRWL